VQAKSSNEINPRISRDLPVRLSGWHWGKKERLVLCRTEKRDTRREAKALKAAKVENAIEQELLNRLKQGTYGDIYNFDQKVYERVLQAAEVSLMLAHYRRAANSEFPSSRIPDAITRLES